MNAHNFIPLIDLTCLNNNDTDERIRALCDKAKTPYGAVAAVCVYPQFVSVAAACLHNINIATVINFPNGDQSIDACNTSIQQSIADGADELDVVFPYRAFLSGEKKQASEFVQTIRLTSKHKSLKIILESGAFTNSATLIDACRLCVECGVDFLKTSTGKIDVGATPDAVAAMLSVLQAHPNIGLKISGGVRSIVQAEQYYRQVATVMGESWINPQHLRFGASSLLQAILQA